MLWLRRASPSATLDKTINFNHIVMISQGVVNELFEGKTNPTVSFLRTITELRPFPQIFLRLLSAIII